MRRREDGLSRIEAFQRKRADCLDGRRACLCRPPTRGARGECRHRALGSDASARLAIGGAVADFEYLDRLDPGGGAELDGVALARL